MEQAKIETLTVAQTQALMSAKRDSLAVQLLCTAVLDPKASTKVWTAAMARLVDSYNAWQAEEQGKLWRPSDNSNQDGWQLSDEL